MRVAELSSALPTLAVEVMGRLPPLFTASDDTPGTLESHAFVSSGQYAVGAVIAAPAGAAAPGRSARRAVITPAGLTRGLHSGPRASRCVSEAIPC